MAARLLPVVLLLGLASCKAGPAPVEPSEPATPARDRDPIAQQQRTNGQTTDEIEAGDRRIVDGGVAALEAGDFEKARLVFSGLRDRYPENTEIERLHDEAIAGLAGHRQRANSSVSRILEPVAFRRHSVREAPVQQRPVPPKLVEVSKERNEIIDDERWFADNDLRMPRWELPVPSAGRPGNLPPQMPRTAGDRPLIDAIRDGDHTIGLYAKDYSDARVVVVFDDAWKVEASFDFSNWSRSPKDRPADAAYTEQRVIWALVRDGVLFVSSGHNTYAKSSGGLNAFITALDLETGEVLWRSDPLVANATNFIYEDGYIITGYGFTAEPDFMFVLDAKTGATIGKTKVKSGPSYILKKGQQVLVRTYDTNYVFDLRD